MRWAVTKRSILEAFTVCVFYRMDKDHHIRRFTNITCCDIHHEEGTDSTITWLYKTYLAGRNGMTKNTIVYICSRCAYRTIRSHCPTPIEATRYMFTVKNNRPIVMARHTPSSKVFIAQVLQYDRVTNKLLTNWILSLYDQVA